MKKALSLLLVLVLALGMSTVAFADAGPGAKINKAPGNSPGFSNISHDFSDAEPGDSWSFALTKSMFPDNDGKWGTATQGTVGGPDGELIDMVLKKDITKSKLTIRTKVSKGSNVIKKVELEYEVPASYGTTDKDILKTLPKVPNGARVYIELIKPFKSNNTDGQDFDFTVYPVLDGRAWSDLGAQITGTLKNEEVEIDGATDYVDLSYSAIAVVDEYAKSVEYALGEGVSLFGRAIKGAKYWGVANKDATEAEDEMMVAKGIEEVFHVPVIGLNNIASYVLLSDADPDAYVYDKNLNYLGLAKERLPYSETYYLAAKKLDLDLEEEPEEEEEEDDEEGEIPVAPPITGGEGTAAPTYDNPSTGK